jgi:ATP-dependent Clp protease ATP-binding subunit ClpA
MISPVLQSYFTQAIMYAKQQRHEYITTDHVFMVLLQDEHIRMILTELSIDAMGLVEALEEFINNNTPNLKDGISQEPIETISLTHAIENMISSVKSNKKNMAESIDMFVSIIKDPNSYSSYLLRKEGVHNINLLQPSQSSQPQQYAKSEDEESDMPESILLDSATELVELAKENKLDPVIGREKEIQRAVEVLTRRKKNNPLLIGEPGVGKTAIANGLAQLVASKSVPKVLKDAKIFSLDMGSLVAGTKYRGDFEKKFKQLLKEIESIENAILFIDEIHTLVGAGAAGESSMDASNLLKPLLSEGKLKCIGATTFAEFKNDFSKDKALLRRFSKIDIVEPSKEISVEIINGLIDKYEDFHGVKYDLDAITTAVDLSKKFVSDKFLPDSAIDVIDEAGAKKSLTKSTKSKKVITKKDIQKTIEQIANIESKNSTKSDTTLLKNLEKNLKKRIYGQDRAVEVLVNAIKINKAGLGGDRKPIGSFLFAGPTGVGKTELAKELASELGVHFSRFDMSEYMESYSISRLIGAPAGYVGFDKGGLLTEEIRKYPSCVLLLDEIEKAHTDLMSVLLQVLDNAELTDNNGDKADFQNVIIIMTSNLGATGESILGFAKQENIQEDRAIKGFFSPEFRNRLDKIVYFSHLDMDIVTQVVNKFISDLNAQVANKNIKLKISTKAKKALAELGYDKEMGGRPLARVITDRIKQPLTDMILFGELVDGGEVKIDYKKDEFSFEVKDRVD